MRFDQTSGLCSFADPIYRVFAMAHFHKNGQSHSSRSLGGDLDLGKFLKMLEVEMSKGLPSGAKLVIKTASIG